jgi:hypothetical protein
MRMHIGILLLVISRMAVAGEAGLTYADARKIWEKNKDKKEYQIYAEEFAQFSNHFHLDEKDGCYNLAGGHVELILVISHRDDEEFAVIEQVLSNSNSPKAQCFKRTYNGLRTKVPSFVPFTFQMSMG